MHQSAAVQKDLNRLEKCAEWNLMKLNKQKSKALHQVRNLGTITCQGLSSWKAFWRKGPEASAGQQVEHEPAKSYLASKKVSDTLGCIRESISSKLREMIFSHHSTLVRPYLEC